MRAGVEAIEVVMAGSPLEATKMASDAAEQNPVPHTDLFQSWKAEPASLPRWIAPVGGASAPNLGSCQQHVRTIAWDR
jgi:hypothetical protein